MNLPLVASSSPQISSFLSLPQEVVGNLLSFLDLQGIQNLSQTSKRVLKATIAETNIKDRIVMDSCIDIVCSRLDNKTQSEQKKSLLELKPSAIRRFPNLLEAKMSISSLKNRIVNVLMTLNKGELTALEGISVPGFCKSIGCLVEICKRIPVANSIRSSSIRHRTLQVISKDLAAAEEIDKALEVAKSIPDEMEKGSALRQISQTLQNISKDLAAAGEIDRAIGVAHRIPYRHTRNEALQAVSFVLLAEGKIDKAFDVANSIQHDNDRDRFFDNISTALSGISRDLKEIGEIDRAIEAAKRILDKHLTLRNNALKDICQVLIGTGEIDKAFDIAKSIQCGNGRNNAFQDISQALVKERKFDRAIEVAKYIDNESIRITVLEDIRRQKPSPLSEARNWVKTLLHMK